MKKKEFVRGMVAAAAVWACMAQEASAAALAVVGGENVKAALGGEVTLRSLKGSYVPRTGALILVE